MFSLFIQKKIYFLSCLMRRMDKWAKANSQYYRHVMLFFRMNLGLRGLWCELKLVDIHIFL